MPNDLDAADIALLTVPEAAHVLRVSQHTVRRWIDRGLVARHRLAGRIHVSEREVLDVERATRRQPRGRPRRFV